MIPRLIFVNRIYPPTSGATALLLGNLADALAKRGHRVQVIACAPPAGFGASRGSDPIKLTAAGRAPARKGGLAQRLITYARSNVSLAAAVWRATRKQRGAVLIIMSDPPLFFLLGPIFARAHGVKLIHWAQDLYPDAVAAAGLLDERSPIYRLLAAARTAALRRYDRVVTLGTCMSRRLASAGVPAAHMRIVRNWAEADAIQSVAHPANRFRQAHLDGGDFLVVYAGNLGFAQSFDALLDAAERCLTELPSVRFLFVADGAQLERLTREVADRGLRNVRRIPMQDWSLISEVQSSADMHVVTQRERMLGVVVPSKLYTAMCSGRPVVYLGPTHSEAADTIRDGRFGFVAGEGDSAALVAAIKHYRGDADARAADGIRARRCAEAASLNASVDEMERVLNEFEGGD